MRRFVYEHEPPPRTGRWRLIKQKTWVDLRGELEAEDCWDREERWRTPAAERTLLYLHGAVMPLLMFEAVERTTFQGNPMAVRPQMIKGWYLWIGGDNAAVS